MAWASLLLAALGVLLTLVNIGITLLIVMPDIEKLDPGNGDDE